MSRYTAGGTRGRTPFRLLGASPARRIASSATRSSLGRCDCLASSAFKTCLRTIASAAWPEDMVDRRELTVLRLFMLNERPLTPVIAETWLIALSSVAWLAWLAWLRLALRPWLAWL